MKAGAFFVDKNGNLIGLKDSSKLDNAKWYQRLLAKISNKYRNSLITLKPIETDYDLTYLEDMLRIETPLSVRITKDQAIDEDFIKSRLNDKSEDKRWKIKPE